MIVLGKSQKAEQIAQILRQRIVDSDYQVGDRLPAREALREEFQVSNATLQRAMNWLVEEGFLEADGRRGTFVRQDSPHLTRYALLFPKRLSGGGPTNHLYRVLLHQAQAVSGGREVIIQDGFEGRAGFLCYDSLLKEMEQNRLAGLIFASSPFVLEGTPLLADDGLPRVGLMTSLRNHPHIPAVYFDFKGFLQGALERLLVAKRHRIAWLTYEHVDHASAVEIQTRLAEQGIQLPDKWLHGLPIGQTTWTRNLLRLMFAPGQERPDGLVVANDNLLPGVSAELKALGVRVPEDLYLIAHANFPEPTASALPVDRLGFSISELLHTALSQIDRLRQGETVPPSTLLQVRTADEAASSIPYPTHC